MKFRHGHEQLMFRTFLVGLLLLMTLTHTTASAENQESCIIPPEMPVNLDREATDFLNIGVDIGKASEGILSIDEAEVVSPTGDFTIAAGPYDPSSGRLYIWGYFVNGWVDVHSLEKGDVRPKLYASADEIEDVTYVLRSEALGVQFYSGWTAPHWLTRHQSFRVFMMSGEKATRIRALEKLYLHYIGDDPATNLAVFMSLDGNRALVWFDGAEIVKPPYEIKAPMQLCPTNN